MAGISKKKTSKGIKYTITYRDIKGKQHTYGIYNSKKEAKEHLNEIDVKSIKITYGEIFNYYFKKVKDKYSKSTIDNYTRYYDNYLKDFENIQYDKIDSIQWQNYFNEIENKSPHIAQICLKMAKAAVNYSRKHNIIKENIFNRIEKAELPKADINHLTIEELKFVLEQCNKYFPDYYVLLYTFIGTGAREGEIFALTKEDFNYKEKCLYINKQFTKGNLVLHPKTKSSNRTIYIFDDLANLLKIHIKTLNVGNPLLFPNKAGNYINHNNFRNRVWKPLLKLCNINKRVRLHDLRGSYIDMTLSQGLSIKFTQNQVGHSRSEVTLNTYAKNNKDMINGATECIGNIFQKKCEHNVSITSPNINKKIIHFPKKVVDTLF